MSENSCVKTNVVSSNTVTVNMAFQYTVNSAINPDDGSRILPHLSGVRYDKDMMKEMAHLVPGDDVEIYEEMGLSKEAILRKISTAIKDKQNVLFNYSGHGMKMPKITSENRLDVDGDAFFFPLPNFPYICGEVNEKLKQRKDTADWNTKFIKMRRESLPKENLSKAQKEKVKAELVDVETKTLKSLEVSKDELLLLEDCQQYMITAKDISNLFQGKNVMGVVDACYSGLFEKDFKSGASAQIALSSGPYEVSADSALVKYPTDRINAFRDNLKLLTKGEDYRLNSLLTSIANTGGVEEGSTDHQYSDTLYGLKKSKKINERKRYSEYEVKSEKALQLFNEKNNIEEEIRNTQRTHGGQLMTFLRTRGMLADKNKDGELTLGEFFSDLPPNLIATGKFEENPSRQHPSLLSEGCVDSFSSFVLPKEGLDRLSRNLKKPFVLPTSHK